MAKINRIFMLLGVLMIVGCQSTPNENNADRTSANSDYSDSLLIKGKEFATITGKTLKGELAVAMQRGGVKEAIKYCNANAHLLTDSISKTEHVSIYRIAEKNRSPKNTLDSSSQLVFSAMKKAIEAGEKVGQIITTEEGKHVFYAPIRLEGACLSCHGTKAQIGNENLEIIQEHYPNDKAIGFKPGDLRGLWKIEF